MAGPALTMGTTAERSWVSRRSVYLHFATRADLLVALYDYVYRGTVPQAVERLRLIRDPDEGARTQMGPLLARRREPHGVRWRVDVDDG